MSFLHTYFPVIGVFKIVNDPYVKEVFISFDFK